MRQNFSTLYEVSSTGKLKEWTIWVESIKTGAMINVKHGYVDGKMQIDPEEINEGKNLGKSNETTAFEQACAEAQSKWNKKIDKGYTESKSGKSNKSVILPVLATKYAQRSHDVKFPAFVQPKLNGIRCVAYDRKYQSRLGKFWSSMSHLDSDLSKLQKIIGKPIDGEVYLHGLNLQDIGSLVKKERIDDSVEGYKTEDLDYYIFDYVDTEKNFEERDLALLDAFHSLGATTDSDGLTRLGHLVLVPTFKVTTHEEIQKYHKIFVANGYEGTIVRNNVPYEINKRTKNLQKVKNFLDDEYKIIGGKEGTGREKGCVVFHCVTKEGKEFDARPIGTVAQRKRWFKELKSIIGKKATIRYQEKTKDNIPFHARLIAIRDYE